MKITLKQLKSKLNNPVNRNIFIAGLAFGIIGSIASNLSDLFANIFSWLLLLVAIFVSYYKARSTKPRSISQKFKSVVKSSILFLVPSSATSLVVNIIFITFRGEWGLSGVNILTLSGLLTLVFGILVGFLSQMIIFVVFGMIGVLFVGKKVNNK